MNMLLPSALLACAKHLQPSAMAVMNGELSASAKLPSVSRMVNSYPKDRYFSPLMRCVQSLTACRDRTEQTIVLVALELPEQKEMSNHFQRDQ